MADESVKVVLHASTDHYGDINPYEATYAALSAALGVGTIISDVTTGEDAGRWADHVVDDLHTAQRIILRAAKSSLEALWLDNWRAHALLGEYGSEAKARAEAGREGEVQS
ncbi:hypothetical protein [Frateuria terrea]|uniref:Uncharacterized protein n=1 Tax=Frateuria terrea TaxID=529704 RepID=A0A1H6UMJ6_9GAMM|nr:hypothetical protein [Frateuria terrea]SEI92896.1 hypothetical protein SAMN04487997_2069 [Frateuria terrea]SFP35059.1 hypothetical protein SAMN02927913_1658 [Frateuria terrea]